MIISLYLTASYLENLFKRHGVAVPPVDINFSRGNCTVTEGKIRLGFHYVKEMGEAAITGLETEQNQGPFSSLHDLYRRTDLSREILQNLMLGRTLKIDEQLFFHFEDYRT